MAMKLITTALIAGLVPAAAFAQSPPFLTNSTPSVSPFVQSPAVKSAETTGAGVSLDPMLLSPDPIVRGRFVGTDSGFRKVSPASPAQGTKQTK
jgi:hypothetical protein